jgi:RNA polymerase sigma factor (sigma-70 family)
VPVPLSDADLLEAARKGDEEAWEQIVSRYQPLINAISRRHRLAPYDAHDVSQYVWMQLLGHICKLRESHALPGWISTTTTRRCYQILRTYGRSVSVDPLAIGCFDLVGTIARRMEGEAPFGVDDDLLRAERCRAIRQGLAELTETQQQLLLMLVADPPVPYREISQLLNLAVGSIGPTRARLLKKLRRTIAVRLLIEDPPSAILRGRVTDTRKSQSRSSNRWSQPPGRKLTSSIGV